MLELTTLELMLMSETMSELTLMSETMSVTLFLASSLRLRRNLRVLLAVACAFLWELEEAVFFEVERNT